MIDQLVPEDLTLPLHDEKETASNAKCGVRTKTIEERRIGNHPWALKIIGKVEVDY